MSKRVCWNCGGKIYEEHPKVDGCLGCSLYAGTYFICEFIEVHCTSEDREDGKDVILKIKESDSYDTEYEVEELVVIKEREVNNG